MAGVDFGGLQVAVVDPAGAHERQAAVDLAGQRLVAGARGRGPDELAVPVVHQMQRGQARRGQRAHQVHRGAGVGVGAHQPRRVVLAGRGVGREAVDHVAAVGLQPQRVDVRRPRLGVLARDARHLDHRHAGAVGEHHRHLQQGADVGPDVGLGVVDERLRAVAALQQERLTAGDVGQQALEPLDLRGHRHRRNALQDRPHHLGRFGIPAGLLRRRLGQRGVQPMPQVIRQRRQRRQLVDGYVDGPVHPFMVTGADSCFLPLGWHSALSIPTSSAETAAGCAWRRPGRHGRHAAAAASAANRGPPRTAAARG